MAEWVYKAITPEGRVIAGVEKAGSELQLEQVLQQRGDVLLESKSKAVAMSTRVGHQRVSPKALVDFSHQLAILSRSGVPLVAGLGDLVEELDDLVLRQALSDVHDRVSRGEQLSSALARYPRIFKDDYVQIIVSGEESGELAVSLERLADSMEWRIEMARRFRSAFAYPAVLMTAVTGLLTLIVTWLVPRLSQVFIDAGVKLPAITRGTLAVAEFLKNHALLICSTLGLMAVTPLLLRSTAKGLRVLHGGILRLPMAGNLTIMMEAARFSNMMALLINAGIPLVRALEITRDATRNLVIRDKISNVHRDVLRGKPFSQALREASVFPSLVLRMVAIGEQSGSLVEALDRATVFFDKEVPRQVKKFLGILEPSITIVMGVAVCFAVFSAFLPMTRLLGAIRG